MKHILKTKTTEAVPTKPRLEYLRTFTYDQLIKLTAHFVTSLRKNGTVFLCCDNLQEPIGSCMRTPSYLSVMFILENLLKYGHIELCEEQEGRRMLVKGQSSIYSLSEQMNVLLKDVE